MYYWVTFKNHSPGCVIGENPTAAMQTAFSQTGELPDEVKGLPYKAMPMIGQDNNEPAFCFTPERCAGHSCCTRSISCVD